MKKVAVITGGTGALGKAVCAAFANAQYEIYLTALNDEEKKTYDGPGQVNIVDLSNIDSAREWATHLPSPIHSAALLAGGFRESALENLTEEHITTLWKMNVLTAFHSLSVLIPHLEKANGASVVLVGAQAYKGAPSISVYSATKSAIVSLTRSASMELKTKKIRVNCILPNIIDTPANRQAMPQANFDTWAKPEEIAQVILFLCSEKASLINGAALPLGR